jgi:hypothetical protein
VLIVLVFIFTRVLVNVGGREIRSRNGAASAAECRPAASWPPRGRSGHQAEVLKPGLHPDQVALRKVVRKVPLVEIGSDELA